MRRVGYERWRRNLAVALGNALRKSADVAVRDALLGAVEGASPMVREHIEWALEAVG
jgi:epoxyqueuosine reductase